MRILILNWKDCKNPSSGGAEIVTFEHAKRWVKKGHEVIWLASNFKNGKKEEKIDGVNFRRFGNIYTIYLFAPFFYLFSKNKFDLVIDEVHGIPFFTPLYCRKPILVLLHEVAGEIWDYMYPFPINIFGRFLEKIYLRLYSRKFFWTDAQATIDELVKKGIKREDCIAIPCPSNVKVLPSPNQKDNEISFVWVSRIVKMKGIEDVLSAFKIIQETIPNSDLKIIGNGAVNYVDYLKNNLVKKNGLEKNVKFLGFVSEIEKQKILRESHILLHASVKEGWGIVVIEAASQSTPSVVYDVPGLSESVKNNVTGIVLSKNTPDEMAKASISLLKNKTSYRKFQENCLKWSRSLNWETASSQSLSLIDKISKTR